MKFVGNLLESWFKSSNFYSKCKTNIKMTMMRIEMIQRRGKAMEKFLRNDVADLLRNGFDSDAYSRAEGLYLDQKRSLCYQSVDQFCTIILDHLEAMKDRSECPEECREAISSLMYGAARLAGLPELRELRNLFSVKYGNSLESFVNKEFVKLLKPDLPTKDMKIQMMKEIALEHGIEWDPDSSKRKPYKPISSNHDLSQKTYVDQDNEPKRTNHENGWKISVQETRTQDRDDRNRAEKNKVNTDIEKQTDYIRERLLNYWSRTTSLFSSSSRETSSSTTPEESSSDDSTNRRSFFRFRFMPPPYVKPDRQDDSNKENQEVFTHPKIEISDDGEVTAPPNGKSRHRRRRGGARPRAKSHSTECLPDPMATEAQKGLMRSASCKPESNVRSSSGHVHPKLPDYDDIIARFTALRAKHS